MKMETEPHQLSKRKRRIEIEGDIDDKMILKPFSPRTPLILAGVRE